MKRILTLLIATASLLAVGVGAAAAGRIVKVGPSSNGKTTVLQPSDVLVVSLPGNTGYKWRVRSVDKTVLRPGSVTYVPRKAPSGKAGTGGTFTLRFRALRLGTTSLRLGYVRAGGTRALKAYTLNVVVKELPPRD
jgi:predicted secreted protein